MESNLIAVVCLLAFMAICCTVDAAPVNSSCPLPPKLGSTYDYDWKSKPHEWSNPNVKTASLQLALSWSPTYCASLSKGERDQQFQCKPSNDFGLIVHGLWPQASKASSVKDHPRNCRNEKQLNETMIKRFFCMMPGEYLQQSEWEKHGTCYFATATDYFTTVEKLYKSLNIPDIRAMKNPTATTIKDSFLKLNPKLPSSSIKVIMESSRLKEIDICYGLNLQFANC
ncbi:unnamed protein product [Rotaria sordida]|uniref:Uncharacterized protein n=1 Tax=Rotaria sordida TaxID=392033 RepID=A0A814KHB5_9BILA|nr:unnamed protein product [Rotaria sordida]